MDEKVQHALESVDRRHGPKKIPVYPFPRLIKVAPPWETPVADAEPPALVGKGG